MILQGDLKDFSLPDVLQLLLQQKKTGVLALQRMREQSEIILTQGNIIGVRVGATTPESRIREMLLASGRIPRKELETLEILARDMNRPLLTTLSAKGIMSEDERDSWYQIACEDMVCDLFSWTDGTYNFSTSQKATAGWVGNLKLSTEFACMEGMRRIDEWPRLRNRLPSDGAVFQLIESSKSASTLDEDHQRVLAEMDGRRNLGQIGQRVPFGTFRLRECVVDLWDAGLVLPIGEAESKGPTESQQDLPEESDRKKALLLGVASLTLVGALALRLVGLFVMNQQGLFADGFSARVIGTFQRRNVMTFLLENVSRTGVYPAKLQILAEEGSLSPQEIRGPDGARIKYRVKEKSGFELE